MPEQMQFQPFIVGEFQQESRVIRPCLAPCQVMHEFLGQLREIRRLGLMRNEKIPYQQAPLRLAQEALDHRKEVAHQGGQIVKNQLRIDSHPARVQPRGYRHLFGIPQMSGKRLLQPGEFRHRRPPCADGYEWPQFR